MGITPLYVVWKNKNYVVWKNKNYVVWENENYSVWKNKNNVYFKNYVVWKNKNYVVWKDKKYNSKSGRLHDNRFWYDILNFGYIFHYSTFKRQIFIR